MAVVGRPHISATGLALAALFASGSRLPDQSEIRRLLLQMIPGGENYCRRILRRFVVYFNRRVNALLLCPGCRRIMAICMMICLGYSPALFDSSRRSPILRVPSHLTRLPCPNQTQQDTSPRALSSQCQRNTWRSFLRNKEKKWRNGY